MSDTPESATGPHTDTAGTADYPRPGDILRQAREARNLTQLEVTERLRLHPTYVPAMESNDFAELPGDTFVRGYLRAYARLLELPIDDVLKAYEHHYGQQQEYRVSSIQTVKPQARLSDPVMRFATIGVIAALVVFSLAWWQTRTDDKSSVSATANDQVAVDTAEGETIVENTGVETIEPETETAESSADESAEAPEALTPETAPPVVESGTADSSTAEEGTVAGTEQPSAPLESAAVPQAVDIEASEVEPVVADTTDPNSFTMKFDADCWVEVRNGNGQRILAALKRAGEELEISGEPPFRLKIGNAEGAQLIYQGETIDLAPHTNRKNIARVTIPQ